jgi:hypothetical protein
MLTVSMVGQVQAVPVTTVDNVTYSSPALTVSGLAMAAQTVTAHITTPTASTWQFHLAGTGGSGALRAMDAIPTLTSGTSTNGTWSATVYMPSTADGTWSLSSVNVCAPDCGGAPIAVPAAPTFTVTGHHQPRLSLGVVPSPLPYPQKGGVVKGRVIDSDTLQGMPGVAIGYSNDANCVQFPPDGPIGFLVTKKTNSGGYYDFSPTNLLMLNCVGIWGSVRHNSDGYSVFPAFRTFSVTIKPLVTASAGAARAKVGTTVAVQGQAFDWNVWNGRGRIVQVQQLRGSTQWRTVATVNVRLNGRLNATVSPTVHGTNIYRAFTPALTNSAPSSSRSFTIVGT